MNDYVIFTDSSADIPSEVRERWGVPCSSLTFRFEDGLEHTNDDMQVSVFYARMRSGEVARTAAINAETFIERFTEILEDGRDLIYVGFSSGLSTTYNSARLAVETLRGRFPERRIYAVDSLAASAGVALLIDRMLEKKRAGASIDEVYRYAESVKLSVCHWFTVDDLVYLKRGGRVSPTAAMVGNLLGIKPVLHVDDEGHLVNVSKVRGRRASLAALSDALGRSVLPGEKKVFISHGDCREDAELLAKMIEERYGMTAELISEVGPVIGAHSGPGTLALFFLGNKR